MYGSHVRPHGIDDVRRPLKLSCRVKTGDLYLIQAVATLTLQYPCEQIPSLHAESGAITLEKLSGR